MTLRKQLIIVSLCLLALPWAGSQYVQEMESVLRQNQQQILKTAAFPITQIIKNTVNEQMALQPHSTDILYAPYRESPIAIDGYDDEWKHYVSHPLNLLLKDPHKQSNNTSSPHYFKITMNEKYLLLFIHVNDNHIVYHHPNSPSPAFNDHIRITTGSNQEQKEIILYTSGPGDIQAVASNISNSANNKKHWKPLAASQHINGYWQEVTNNNTVGYNIELNIPLTLAKDYLEITVFNNDSSNPLQHTIAQRLATSTTKTLRHPILSLTNQLSAFRQSSWDIAIIDTDGWPLSPQSKISAADQPKDYDLDNTQSVNLWESALSHFYRYLMEDILSSESMPSWPINRILLSQSTGQISPAIFKNNQDQWYKVKNTQRSILSVSTPILNKQQQATGYVVLTQSSDALLSLTNNALFRIINLSLTTAALSALILLGFASVLSYRIRRLRNQTENAVNQDGKVQSFSASKAHDEIGDLSRSYAGLLQRIHDYNKYLETLSGKLAHELRTPLTISKSSIEMLKMVEPQDTEKQQRYLSRAEEGLERLRLILNAMSEASRVEQAIQHADIHDFDIAILVNDMCQAYQDSYPDFQFDFIQHESLASTTTNLRGAPELIAQMLDKLVTNATEFAPINTTIRLSLMASDLGIRLSIENTGPLLPDNMQQQLFDSMVSIRNEPSNGSTGSGSDTPHLGLGLYIVKLIVKYHQGQLSARNNNQQNGVVFHIDLPLR